MDQRFDITLPPGVVKSDSPYAVKGRYIDTSFVRSWQGKMQKWKGWGNYYNIAFTEPGRGGVVWNANDGTTLSAYGTANKLWLIKRGVRYDITPQALPTGLVTSGAADTGWGDGGWGDGPWGGGWSSVPGQEAFARVWTLARWGEDIVACPRGGALYTWRYSTGDTVGRTMTGNTNATTTVSVLSAAANVLVGARVTGSGIPVNTFVVSVNVGAATMVISNAATATATGVSLQFDMPAITLASLTADALLPTSVLAVFVTDDRHLIALGAAQTPKTYDPLNIAWCNREDYLVWTPTTLNTAGAIRCESGNQIMGAAKVFGGYLVLTDLSAHPFTFIGGDDIWGLDRIGSQSGAIGPQVMTEMDGVAYWLGFDAHYSYNGRVNKIPCDVHAHVFDNLNRFQAYKIVAGTNRAYNELIFFWPDLTGVENNQYHAVNLTDSTWSKGSGFSRTVWIDANALFKTPIGVDGTNYKIYEQDAGTTADGVPIDYLLETGEIELRSQSTLTGDQFIRLKKIVPDYAYVSGTHTLTVYARGYPSDTAVAKGPYSLTANKMFNPKARFRSARFRWTGSGDFRMGDFQAYGAPDGGRR